MNTIDLYNNGNPQELYIKIADGAYMRDTWCYFVRPTAVGTEEFDRGIDSSGTYINDIRLVKPFEDDHGAMILVLFPDTFPDWVDILPGYDFHVSGHFDDNGGAGYGVGGYTNNWYKFIVDGFIWIPREQQGHIGGLLSLAASNNPDEPGGPGGTVEPDEPGGPGGTVEPGEPGGTRRTVKLVVAPRDFIISGPPGSGKSHFVDNNVLEAIIGGLPSDNEDKYERVLFSDSLYHESFFGGYRPVNSKSSTTGIGYEFRPGPFCNILKEALKDPDSDTQNYALIIEELNRGDAYDIFGQLFQLLDRDETGKSKYEVSIPDEAVDWFCDNGVDLKNVKKIYLPSNFYIICTVNNSDSGVHFIDTAMKRRFHMIYLDEDGYIYGAAYDDAGTIRKIIPYVDNGDPTLSGIVKTTDKSITREQWQILREEINKVIAKNSTEDKLLSEHFVDFDNSAGDNDPIMSVDGFIVKVIGYLFQNVFRGRKMDEILNNEDRSDDEEYKTVIGVLKAYHDGSGLKLVDTGNKDNSILAFDLSNDIG